MLGQPPKTHIALRADIDLAVGDGRDGKFYRGVSWSAADWLLL